MTQTFWDKHKVLILGALGAALLIVQQFMDNGVEKVDWKSLGFAAFIAIVGYIGRELRGQGMTITGIIGTVAYVFHNEWGTDTFTWDKFILAAILAIGTTALPDFKSRGYENTEVIKQAKKEGEQIQPAKLTAKPK